MWWLFIERKRVHVGIFIYWFLLYFLFIIDEQAFSTIDPRIFCKFMFKLSHHPAPTKAYVNSIIVQVDFMLGSYMEDIGITSQQFEAACGKGSKRSFQHGLFEQVRRFFRLSLSCLWLVWRTAGLGGGGFWDLQADDDSEEYWTPAPGFGAPTTKVTNSSQLPRVVHSRPEIRCHKYTAKGKCLCYVSIYDKGVVPAHNSLRCVVMVMT